MNKQIDLVVPNECLSMIDCWEAIIVMLFTFYGKDCNKIYASPDFYYDHSEPTTNSLTLDTIFRRTMALKNEEVIEEFLSFYEKFYSIKFEIVPKTSVEEMKIVIEEELHKNNPVVVFVDTYHCNFNKMHQKYHYFHAFIISGIDGDKLTIADPTQHMECLEVKIDDVYLCTENVIKVKDIKSEIIQKTEHLIKYRFIIENFRSTKKQKSKIKNMEAFFTDLKENKDEVFKSFEHSEEPLCIMITWLFKNISLNIKKCSNFIEKTFSQEALPLLAMLKDNQTNWMLLGRIFMKMYYAKEKIREELFVKICNLMSNIINIEKAIIEEFIILLELENIQLEERLYDKPLSITF